MLFLIHAWFFTARHSAHPSAMHAMAIASVCLSVCHAGGLRQTDLFDLMPSPQQQSRCVLTAHIVNRGCDYKRLSQAKNR